MIESQDLLQLGFAMDTSNCVNGKTHVLVINYDDFSNALFGRSFKGSEFSIFNTSSCLYVFLRWKSRRVCRFGSYCTFAHGTEELRSWMEYNTETQETRSTEESSSQKPETNADISRSEVWKSQPKQQ